MRVRSLALAAAILLAGCRCGSRQDAGADAGAKTDPNPQVVAPPPNDPTTGAVRMSGEVVPEKAECPARKGGARITFLAGGEPFVLWIVNDAFVQRAEELQKAGTEANPIFREIRNGADCDAKWTWHASFDDAVWVDVPPQGCGGRPSDVERDKAHWIANVKQFCPTAVKVVSLERVAAEPQANPTQNPAPGDAAPKQLCGRECPAGSHVKSNSCDLNACQGECPNRVLCRDNGQQTFTQCAGPCPAGYHPKGSACDPEACMGACPNQAICEKDQG